MSQFDGSNRCVRVSGLLIHLCCHLSVFVVVVVAVDRQPTQQCPSLLHVGVEGLEQVGEQVLV